jgi:hypothetical protein
LLTSPTKCSENRFACIIIVYYYYYYYLLHVSALSGPLSGRKQVKVTYNTTASIVIRNCSSVFSLMMALKGPKHVGDDSYDDDDDDDEEVEEEEEEEEEDDDDDDDITW